MKDMLGREITVGCYIAYGLIVGRSANLAVYHVRGIEGKTIKAHKLNESYGVNNQTNANSLMTLNNGKTIPAKYTTYAPDAFGKWEIVEMSDREKDIVDNKIATLRMGERALVIDEKTIDFLKTL